MVSVSNVLLRDQDWPREGAISLCLFLRSHHSVYLERNEHCVLGTAAGDKLDSTRIAFVATAANLGKDMLSLLVLYVVVGEHSR